MASKLKPLHRVCSQTRSVQIPTQISKSGYERSNRRLLTPDKTKVEPCMPPQSRSIFAFGGRVKHSCPWSENQWRGHCMGHWDKTSNNLQRGCEKALGLRKPALLINFLSACSSSPEKAKRVEDLTFRVHTQVYCGQTLTFCCSDSIQLTCYEFLYGSGVCRFCVHKSTRLHYFHSHN